MWAKFLLDEFDKPQFEKLLDTLIVSATKGKSFSPPIKSWFTDFTSVDPSELKVVLISKDFEYVPHLPKMLDYNLEELNKQGVMFYALSRTSLDGESQLDDWRMFNIYFLDYLISNFKDIVYVFIGYNALDFSELVTTGEHGYKIFLPEADNAIWEGNSLTPLFKNNINNILENCDKDTINW